MFDGTNDLAGGLLDLHREERSRLPLWPSRSAFGVRGSGCERFDDVGALRSFRAGCWGLAG